MTFWRRLFGKPPGASPRSAAPPEPPTPIDPVAVARVFTDTTIKDHHITVIRLGALVVPTGRIVACDVLASPESPVFDRTVTPGTYPVEIAIARSESDERCTAARLVVSERPTVTWESAGSYGVDAGVGCFMDGRTRDMLLAVIDANLDDPSFNYYDSVLATELVPGWTMHQPVQGKPDNIAIFMSGWGDGIYETYVGLDSTDQVTCFMTNFEVV